MVYCTARQASSIQTCPMVHTFLCTDTGACCLAWRSSKDVRGLSEEGWGPQNKVMQQLSLAAGDKRQGSRGTGLETKFES